MPTMTLGRRATKKVAATYWVATSLFVLLDAVPAIGFNTPAAIEGIRHLGFPDYFRVELALGKILGDLLLVLPMVPARLKEWAYVGFGISLISAIIGHLVIDTGIGQVIPPAVGLVILTVSYVYFHKRQSVYSERE